MYSSVSALGSSGGCGAGVSSEDTLQFYAAAPHRLGGVRGRGTRDEIVPTPCRRALGRRRPAVRLPSRLLHAGRLLLRASVPCSTLHRSRAFPGTNCSYVGATLAEMPVRSGFYRDGEMALSVLRCEPLKACKGAGAQRAEGHLNGLHKS